MRTERGHLRALVNTVMWAIMEIRAYSRSPTPTRLDRINEICDYLEKKNRIAHAFIQKDIAKRYGLAGKQKK